MCTKANVAIIFKVNRKLIPRYYEVISHPIDLATIRAKNAEYVGFASLFPHEMKHCISHFL